MRVVFTFQIIYKNTLIQIILYQFIFWFKKITLLKKCLIFKSFSPVVTIAWPCFMLPWHPYCPNTNGNLPYIFTGLTRVTLKLISDMSMPKVRVKNLGWVTLTFKDHHPGCPFLLRNAYIGGSYVPNSAIFFHLSPFICIPFLWSLQQTRDFFG